MRLLRLVSSFLIHCLNFILSICCEIFIDYVLSIPVIDGLLCLLICIMSFPFPVLLLTMVKFRIVTFADSFEIEF